MSSSNRGLPASAASLRPVRPLPEITPSRMLRCLRQVALDTAAPSSGDSLRPHRCSPGRSRQKRGAARLAAVTSLAFAQVEPAMSVRQHPGSIIRRKAAGHAAREPLAPEEFDVVSVSYGELLRGCVCCETWLERPVCAVHGGPLDLHVITAVYQSVSGAAPGLPGSGGGLVAWAEQSGREAASS